MVRSSFFVISFILVALLAGAFAYIHRGEAGRPASSTGFALVELFTSEGCSSCPPADEVLARTRREYKSNVYVLGFHVDYWNSMGWKDIFSHADYSRRQREYASAFGLNSIFTPQIVVNGRIQFVGSDEATLRKTLEAELKNPAGSPIEANATIGPDKKVQVSYNVRPIQDELLQIALIQFHASTNVEKGENEGRLLEHINLVRDFKTLTVDREGANRGSVELSIPPGLSAADCGIIVFLQQKQSMQVRGAVEIRLR